MEHGFTPTIQHILSKHFGKASRQIFEKSPLLQYINLKTVSAMRGSKARASFANLYAIYVLAEDYIQHGFHKKGNYAEYEGARFGKLFARQRQLPFGAKLQNHGLNDRLNGEFRKFFPQEQTQPILRVVETKRYWINQKLLRVPIGKKQHDLAEAVLEIIDAYSKEKQAAFENFITTCERLQTLSKKNHKEAETFIYDLIAPNVDARIFEIVSYAILKHYYHNQTVYFGFQMDAIEKHPLKLYKTGRTNANDGGIDFVMTPLGRFFQVTETLDIRKYFLDIDKIERYPITFVIKSEEPETALRQKLKQGAETQYAITSIVEKYMKGIEEIINLPKLRDCFQDIIATGLLNKVLDEIIRQSKVEFNYDEATVPDARSPDV